MKHEVDPDRDTPERSACYEDGTTCDNTEHPGWRHAKDWDEVADYVSAGALAADRDGDPIVAVDTSRNVVTLEGGGEYNYSPQQILIEDIHLMAPATPEEEDAALASIMESFGNRRLAQPGDPLT